MVSLRKIQTDLFPNLYRSFLIDDDPLSTEQDWRNVFDYPWNNDQDYCGYALLDDNEDVVGMLGMVFCERTIGGQVRKMCNLHTWWVREDQRAQSLALLRPVLKLKDFTLTHFTPCDTVRAVLRRLGFSDLSSQLRILMPYFWGSKKSRSSLEVISDVDQISAEINEADQQILEHHRPYNIGHLLLKAGGKQCYLVYTHVVRHRLPYCHIHYVSNREFFAENEKAIRCWLLHQHRARFVAVDERLVSDLKLRHSFRFWAPAHGLYKSDDLGPEQIDHLYSDVTFLKLTVLPDLTHELGNVFRRAWPFSKPKP